MTSATSSDTASGTRRYSRPPPEVWTEATDLFLSGAFTLAELAMRFGVSTRAIQIHAARRRAAHKPVSSAATLTSVTATATRLTKATHEACIEQTKASAYDDAVTLQTMIGHALASLAADASVPPTARLRACDQAAVALERTHKLRRVILGMSREDDVAERPLPELPIRVMTDEEVKAIRRKQAADDGEPVAADTFASDDLPTLDDDDQGVIEE